MDQELRTYLEESFGSLRSRMDEEFGQVRGEIGQVREEVGQVRGELEQVKTAVRHTQISVEALRSDLRLVAEGVIGVTDRLEKFQSEMALRFEDVKASIAPYYRDLNERVKLIEDRADRQTEDVLDTIRKKYGKAQT